jgi:hypothetical protein
MRLRLPHVSMIQNELLAINRDSIVTIASGWFVAVYKSSFLLLFNKLVITRLWEFDEGAQQQSVRLQATIIRRS